VLKAKVLKAKVSKVSILYLGFGTLQFSGSLRVNDPFWGALCPSKSGLMNKHIVKHTE
jgi:hypothetical protein